MCVSLSVYVSLSVFVSHSVFLLLSVDVSLSVCVSLYVVCPHFQSECLSLVCVFFSVCALSPSVMSDTFATHGP